MNPKIFNLKMGNIDFALQCPLWPQSKNQKTIFGLDLGQHFDGPIKLIGVVGAVWEVLKDVPKLNISTLRRI